MEKYLFEVPIPRKTHSQTVQKNLKKHLANNRNTEIMSPLNLPLKVLQWGGHIYEKLSVEKFPLLKSII